MDFFSLIRKRRSIRRFLKKNIEEEKITLLEEAALRSPSSRGINPWRFIFVRDKNMIAKFAKAKTHGAEFLNGTPLAIVVCANSSESDVWIEDCSIACAFIQLAAENIGLGSCWAQIRNRFHNKAISSRNYLAEILSLKPEIEIEAIIGIGYPALKPKPHSASKLQWEKISHIN